MTKDSGWLSMLGDGQWWVMIKPGWWSSLDDGHGWVIVKAEWWSRLDGTKQEMPAMDKTSSKGNARKKKWRFQNSQFFWKRPYISAFCKIRVESIYLNEKDAETWNILVVNTWFSFYYYKTSWNYLKKVGKNNTPTTKYFTSTSNLYPQSSYL